MFPQVLIFLLHSRETVSEAAAKNGPNSHFHNNGTLTENLKPNRPTPTSASKTDLEEPSLECLRYTKLTWNLKRVALIRTVVYEGPISDSRLVWGSVSHPPPLCQARSWAHGLGARVLQNLGLQTCSSKQEATCLHPCLGMIFFHIYIYMYTHTYMTDR